MGSLLFIFSAFFPVENYAGCIVNYKWNFWILVHIQEAHLVATQHDPDPFLERGSREQLKVKSWWDDDVDGIHIIFLSVMRQVMSLVPPLGVAIAWYDLCLSGSFTPHRNWKQWGKASLSNANKIQEQELPGVSAGCLVTAFGKINSLAHNPWRELYLNCLINEL